MLRGTLTLLMRSVRADALKRGPHYFRLVSMLFMLYLLITAHISSGAGAPGRDFFIRLAYLGIGLVSLAGMGHFANAITEEKEEGTLALLLLADISPLSILLGKSTNRILSAWLIFIAQFPFALLAITLGGVTVLQIAAAYVSLAAFLFMIANVALLASVLSPKSGIAQALMAIFTMLYFGFVPWVNLVLPVFIDVGHIHRDGWVAHLGFLLDDIYREIAVHFEIERIFESTAVNIFNLQVVSNLILGLCCFGLAWAKFHRLVWIPEMVEPTRMAEADTTSASVSTTTSSPVNTTSRRSPIRISRPWKNALMWKDFQFISGGIVVLYAKVGLLMAFVATGILFPQAVQKLSGMHPTQYMLGTVLLVMAGELIVYSSTSFQSELSAGTLPTLLMLPHSIASIGYNKLLGCLIASAPTVFIFLLIFVCVADKASLNQWIYRWETLFVICGAVVLCQLTILCSLAVRWGAFPLAIALSLVAGFILVPAIQVWMSMIGEVYKSEFSKTGPIIYTTAILSAVLQLEIGRRIHLAASR